MTPAIEYCSPVLVLVVAAASVVYVITVAVDEVSAVVALNTSVVVVDMCYLLGWLAMIVGIGTAAAAAVGCCIVVVDCMHCCL